MDSTSKTKPNSAAASPKYAAAIWRSSSPNSTIPAWTAGTMFHQTLTIQKLAAGTATKEIGSALFLGIRTRMRDGDGTF